MEHVHEDEFHRGSGHDHAHCHHGHSHPRLERRPGMNQAAYMALLIARLIICPGDDILAAGMSVAAPLARVSYAVEQEAVLPSPIYPVMLIDGAEVPIR